jgi:hypothetical protein
MTGFVTGPGPAPANAFSDDEQLTAAPDSNSRVT